MGGLWPLFHFVLHDLVVSRIFFYFHSFFLYIASEKEEGLYSLYFHNCHNYEVKKPKVNFVKAC